MTTYSTLVADIAAGTNREDLTANIPGFIRLTEAQINRELRGHWRMENRATLNTSDGRYIPRPTDWLETIRLSVAGEHRALERVSSTVIADMRARSSDEAGTPRFYRHVEDQFEVYPSPSGPEDYELSYIQAIPAINDSTQTTNWVLTNHYDVYYYGCLTHAFEFLMDDIEMDRKVKLFMAGLESVKKEGRRGNASGNSRRRVRGLGGAYHGRHG